MGLKNGRKLALPIVLHSDHSGLVHSIQTDQGPRLHQASLARSYDLPDMWLRLAIPPKYPADAMRKLSIAGHQYGHLLSFRRVPEFLRNVHIGSRGMAEARRSFPAARAPTSPLLTDIPGTAGQRDRVSEHTVPRPTRPRIPRAIPRGLRRLPLLALHRDAR